MANCDTNSVVALLRDWGLGIFFVGMILAIGVYDRLNK